MTSDKRGGYRLTLQAREDVREIGRYTRRHWGPGQHDRYLKSLEAAFDRLAAAPRQARQRADLAPGVRSLVVGSHIVLFREDAQDAARTGAADIEILRVVHQAMDIQSIDLEGS